MKVRYLKILSLLLTQVDWIMSKDKFFIQTDPALSLVCGGIAGALSRTAVSPMERVKVLFQIQGSGVNKSFNNGTISTIFQIFKEEGYKGLFRGNGINCIRIIPYTAIQYTVYENLKKILTNNGERNLTISEKLTSGMIGGLTSVLFTYPMDLVKTRLSVLTSRSLKNVNNAGNLIDLSMWGNLKSIYLNEGGIRGLYRGFIPTSLGVAPYVSLNFTIFEKFNELAKSYLRGGSASGTSGSNGSSESNYSSNFILTLVLGGLSGGISQTIVYPFDILRRRFQVATMNNGSLGFKYQGTLQALAFIISNEGVKGLYKGWTANMWKIIPSMAVQWSSYDIIRDFIQNW